MNKSVLTNKGIVVNISRGIFSESKIRDELGIFQKLSPWVFYKAIDVTSVYQHTVSLLSNGKFVGKEN